MKLSSNPLYYYFVSEFDKLVPNAVFAYSGGGKREEICTKTSLELRGLTQEEEDSHNSMRKGSKSGKGKKKEIEQNFYSDDEEDYLRPADSRLKRKSHKSSRGSKKKETFLDEVSSDVGDTLIIDEEDDDSSTRGTEQDTLGDVDEEQDQIPNLCSEVWSVPRVSNGSVAEEVIIITSDGDFPDLSNADCK